jgi:glycosyltransferase involved in cell wall biosynthesis
MTETSKTHVLHLINSFDDSSISRIILWLIENTGGEEICWHVGGLSGLGDLKAKFSSLGAQVVDFSRNGENGIFSSIKEIRNYVVTNDIGIVHTHTPHTIIWAFLALIGISNVRHFGTKHLLVKSDDREAGFVFAMLDRLSLYLPDRLIPVSQKMFQQLIRYPGLNRKKITLIRNAIPHDEYYFPEHRNECRRELGLSSDSIALGYAGRIQKVKRIDILLEAFNQISRVYSNTYLVVVGDGVLRSHMESYANTLGISDRIIWTGFRKDVHRILAAIDIYVQTSSNEGLSLSILEAMAARKPVVATDVGGNSEIVKNGITGFLTANGSVAGIVNAVSNLIDNPELRNRLSLAGLKLIQTDFSLPSMVGGYLDLYQTIIAGLAVIFGVNLL